MSKRYSLLISVLFCAVLGFFAVWNALTPDREFSPNENRYLEQRPALSADEVVSGRYMSSYEKYVTDQFVGRDVWISVKALSEKMLGRQENNGVYLGRDGQTLFARFDEPDPVQVERNLGFVSAFAQKAGVPVYFSLIPGKDAVWSDRLPHNAPNGDQWAILAQAEETTAARWVDLSGVLMAHAQDDDPAVFYRLDHHWTSYGAYWGYTALTGAMGLEPVPLENYQRATVSTEFNGTAYSSSGVRWMQPDVIDIYVPEEGITVTSYWSADAQGNPIPSEGELYAESWLEEKDKYSFFLGGQHPLCVIKTGVEGPRLLLVRDSFSDSLAPFLTADFSEIHLLDPRYYKVSPTQYIADHEIDQALVLYSVANFVSDTNLFILGL